MNWKFCAHCTRMRPIPGCPLCRARNRRDPTPEEEATLIEAIRQADARKWPLDIMDIPFEDGTTPRSRKS